MNIPFAFSLDELNTYRENNQFEVKSARGGLPGSIWETYSAFANSEGGVIILGIKEKKDGSLIVEGLDDAAKLIKDFWNMVNNRQKVSCNILTDNMVVSRRIEDKDIIIIKVPRAERTTKPVYVGVDPKSGSYRRNGEGDYHCTIDEVSLMMRDALLITEDNKILTKSDFSVFDTDTIRRYRQIFQLVRPNHLWNKDVDEVFMRRIGAMREDKETGTFHPTAAGLLMFGTEYEITYEFPNYFLDYQENRTNNVFLRWTDRVTSQTGDWSGNVFDFILKILPKLFGDLKVPFIFKGISREEMTPIHKAIRESLVNMITNTDFYGRRGVVVQKGEDGFKFANPGNMRVSVKEAIESNLSDPRNGAIHKMLSFLDYCERAGSGLQSIFEIWKTVYHTEPKVEVATNGVDRTTVILPFNGRQPDIKAMLSLYYTTDGIILKEDNTNDVALNDTNVALKGNDVALNDTNVALKGNDVAPNDTNVALKGNDVAPNDTNVALNLNESIIRIIKNNPNIKREDIARQLSVTKKTIERHLKDIGIIWKGHSKTGYWLIPDNL